MNQIDPVATLLAPLSEGAARIVALRNTTEGQLMTLLGQCEQQGATTLVSRPPMPWEPLAPLRHLCEFWKRPWPEPEWKEEPLEEFWLGIPAVLSRYFARVASRLAECPTVVRIQWEDLNSPLLQRFLQAVRLGQIKLPLCFVYTHPETQPVEPGIEVTRVNEEPVHRKTLSLSRHARVCLGQLLLSGDRWNERFLKKVSKAQLSRRRRELVQAGVLDHRGVIQPALLRDARPLWPNYSLRWRKQALRAMEGRRLGGPQKLRVLFWLTFSCEPLPRSSRRWTARDMAFLLVTLGEKALLQACLGCSRVDDQGRLLVALAWMNQHEQTMSHFQKTPLSTPTRELWESRLPTSTGALLIERLEILQQQLQERKFERAASLLSLEQARWMLAFGRYQTVFSLLQPVRQRESQALQWQCHLLLSEAFSWMNRRDLARGHLEIAVRQYKDPVSPVLTAELRLATLRPLARAGEPMEANLQYKLARETYRAFGDGVRLGHLLILGAEAEWRREQFDDARNLLSRALDLFRQYAETSGILEAQIKLGLVIKKVAAPAPMQ